MLNQVFDVMLVEDNAADALLFKTALEELRMLNTLHEFPNAEDALIYLLSPHEPEPGIVFIDVNLPDMSGLDLIRKIRKSNMDHLPIVVLTGSDSLQHYKEAKELGVDVFMEKGGTLDDIIKMLSHFKDYGFLWVKEGRESA